MIVGPADGAVAGNKAGPPPLKEAALFSITAV